MQLVILYFSQRNSEDTFVFLIIFDFIPHKYLHISLFYTSNDIFRQFSVRTLNPC